MTNIKNKILTDPIRASLYPVPVTLVTCENKDRDNIITISWTGILCSKPPIVYISIRPERFSYNLVKDTNKYVINIPSVDLLPIADKCGNISGRTNDKFEKFNLSRMKVIQDYPPLISECKHHLICDVIDIIEFGVHHSFIGKVKYEYINTDCYESDNRLYDKLSPIAYCRKDYMQLSKKIGHYGFF